MNAVIVDRITKTFGEHRALDSISMALELGKIYGLVGRNGSGKSLLMKCIAGLLRPTSGSISVFGQRIGRDVDFAPDTGIVIEQPGLLMKKSAMKNLYTLASLTSRPVRSELEELLRMIGLDPMEKKAVYKYSMGMKQRLGIAMALVGHPRLLLLDEPMSNLDRNSADDMRALFKELAANGKTLVVATHVQEDISNLCDQVFHMESGKIVG